MISLETACSFSATLDKNIKDNPNYPLELMADLMKKEPNLSVLLTVLLSSGAIKDPTQAGLLAVSIYKKLESSQNESDNLKEKFG